MGAFFFYSNCRRDHKESRRNARVKIHTILFPYVSTFTQNQMFDLALVKDQRRNMTAHFKWHSHISRAAALLWLFHQGYKRRLYVARS